MALGPSQPSLECPDPVLRGQGIERVAVDDARAQLIVTFFAPFTGSQPQYLFDPRSYSLTGGRRLFPRILKAAPYLPGSPPEPGGGRVMLSLDGIGDFSTYTLTVSGPDIDPFFGSRKLRFRVACDDPFDCRAPLPTMPTTPAAGVTIDYLSKDYASFRQALLDFLSTRFPAWTERGEADIGMMLLELFAAAGDTLSYIQDRVAGEAFLSTATQRRSVAAHLALIGYEMDEGAAAYTWLQFRVITPKVLTEADGLRITNGPATPNEPVIVFEPLLDTRLGAAGAVSLDPRHNEMRLYTAGNRECCLPQDAASAVLDGGYDALAAGDSVLFDDGKGHRDVVRLIAGPEIVPAQDAASGKTTVIRWAQTTPLHHAYCADEVIVRGNLVLATHGETVQKEVLRPPLPATPPAGTASPLSRRARLRLRLARAPLAHLDQRTIILAAPPGHLPAATVPSSRDFTARVSRSLSALTITVGRDVWKEQRSLLESHPDAPVFRIEIDDQGDATVVFGDGVFGMRPPETAEIAATYRIGGGSVGNVAAETLVVAVSPEPVAVWLESVTNPLPAVGGRDLESRDQARRFGPRAFRTPLVAVTADDYQVAAQGLIDAGGGHPVKRANAGFHWTGSWLTATLAVDPRGIEGMTPALRRDLIAYLDSRRLTGYDLDVTPAIYLPVDLAILFCAAHGFRASDVQQALQQTLSSAILPDGRKGFFHPDNFSFGDSLYVSQIYSAVMGVPGVESAEITRLARLHAARPDAETASNLRQGLLAAGSDQIIRLDNDRNFPENGVLVIRPKGSGP